MFIDIFLNGGSTPESKKEADINANLLNTGKIDELYARCPSQGRGELTSALLDIEIDVVDYLTGKVPAYCYYKTNIDVVNLSDKITLIEESAFARCKNLNTVLMNAVTEIQAGAFAGCESLRTVALSNNLTTIGAQVFNGCMELKDITIPPKVTDIGLGAFYNCSYDLKIIVPYRKQKITILGADERFLKDHVVITNKPVVHEGLNEEQDNIDYFDMMFNVVDDNITECSTTINEAFSDSTPNWIKSRFLLGKNLFSDHNGRRYKHKYRSVVNDDPNSVCYVGYGGIGRKSSNYFLPDFQKNLMDLGVDLSSAQFHSIDVPSKVGRNSIFTDNDVILAFLLEGPPAAGYTEGRWRKDPQTGDYQFIYLNPVVRQVYIRGINDDEEMMIGPNAGTQFKYIGNKYLLPYIKEMAYIEKNLDSNYFVDRKSARIDRDQELYNIPHYNRYKPNTWVDKTSAGNRMTDRSGYIVIPSEDRFREQLAKLRKQKRFNVVAPKFQEAYDELVKARDILASLVSGLSFDKPSIGVSRSVVNQLTTSDSYYSNRIWAQFRGMVDQYEDLAQQVEVMTDPSSSENAKLDALTHAIGEKDGDWSYYHNFMETRDRFMDQLRQAGLTPSEI